MSRRSRRSDPLQEETPWRAGMAIVAALLAVLGFGIWLVIHGLS